MEDILTVTFDNNFQGDEAGLCVARKVGDRIYVLKMETGEQAKTLYQLLTDQMSKARIE